MKKCFYQKSFIIYAIILLSVMCVNGAAETKREISLYSSGIEEQDHIFFGRYLNEPIMWRVLDSQKSSTDDSNSMFLLSEYVLGDRLLFSDNTRDNSWENSNIKSWCTRFDNDNNFSKIESKVIENTYKVESQYDRFIENILSGDRFFVLSMMEKDIYFGGGNRISPIAMTRSGELAPWWLRSIDIRAEDVSLDHYVTAWLIWTSGGDAVCDLSYRHYIRPAFNMDKSEILFSSIAKGGKNNNIGNLSLARIADESEWKLTLHDNSRGFVGELIDDFPIIKEGYSDISVRINCKNARVGQKEYISAIIADEDKNVLYYGKINQVIDTEVQIKVSLPNGLEEGKYVLYIFNEQCNDNYVTDYSSELKSFPFTVYGDSVIGDVALDNEFAEMNPTNTPILVLPNDYCVDASVLLKYNKSSVNKKNTIVYNVHLIGMDGKEIELPGECILCFPYPNGLNEKSVRKYRIIIHHYGSKETEVFKSEDNEIEFAKQGLCIKIDSFSPFVIEWEKIDIPESPPQTGDDSSILLYGMLLMLSAALLLAMKRRTNRA